MAIAKYLQCMHVFAMLKELIKKRAYFIYLYYAYKKYVYKKVHNFIIHPGFKYSYNI